MTLNYVALTITEQDAGQDAGTGAVLVAPTGPVVAAGVTVVSAAPVSRSLSAGSVTVSLVATDNTGTTPAAGFWAYQVTLPGQQPQTYLVDHANGASQRLDNLTPVVAQTTYGPAASTGAVSSVFGRAGNVTAQSGDYSSFYDATGGAAAALTSAEAYTDAETARAEGAEGTLTTAVTGKVARAGDTMTGHLAPKVVALTDAATIAVDASLGNDFRVTLGGNRTMGVPSNPVDGEKVTFQVTQDGTGSRTLTWPTGSSGNYAFGSGTAPALSTAAGALDVVAFVYNSAKARWLYLGTTGGF